MTPCIISDLSDRKVPFYFILLILFIFILFFSAGLFIPTCDYIAFKYGHGLPPLTYGSSLAETHYSTYRYITSIFDSLITWHGDDYFNLLGFWVVSLVPTLFFCAQECVRTIKLPTIAIPLLILGVGLHGFWAEIIQFPDAYLMYALSLGAVSLALWCGRLYQDNPRMATFLTTFWSTIALMTYQATMLIILFVAILTLIRDAFFESETRQRTLHDIAPLLIGVCGSCILFLMITRITHAIMPGAIDRSYSFALLDIMKNIYAYTLALPLLFFPQKNDIPYYLAFPLHERILYGTTYCATFLILYYKKSLIPFIALMIGILLTAGPMNIFVPGYFPTLRSMMPTAFFQSGLALILGFKGFEWCRHHTLLWTKECIFLGIALSILALSGANQLSILAERWRQYRQDYAIASGIKSDLRSKKALYPKSKVAILAEKRSHIAQLNRMLVMDFPISAFSLSASPSEVAFLKSVSGIDVEHITHNALLPHTQAPNILFLYEALCTGAHLPWELRTIKDITLVCLPALR